MRAPLALILAFLAFPAAAPALPLGGNAPPTVPFTCAQNILPTPGTASATLTDTNSRHWQYPSSTSANAFGNFSITMDGAAYGKGSSLQMGLGDSNVQAYFHIAPLGSPGLSPWYQRNNSVDEFYQVANCGAALPAAPFMNTTTSTAYQSSADMVLAAAANAALQANAMPTNIPAWIEINNDGAATFVASGIAYTCAAGVKFWATNAAGPGQGIVSVQATNVTVNGCEMGYAKSLSFNGPYVGLSVNHAATGFTIRNCYMHDNDHGMITSGDEGVVTVDGCVFDHNGNTSANVSAAMHNIYFSWSQNNADTSAAIIKNVGSFCVGNNDSGTAGFEGKFRYPGTIHTNTTYAAPSQHGYTDCMESAAIDFSCGGWHQLGGAAAGQGVVIEVGLNLGTNGNELIRDYREENSTGNCPSGGWGNTTCQTVSNTLTGTAQSCLLLVQNAWLINDSGRSDANMHIITLGATLPTGFTATVKNSKIVCGFSPCNSTFLGAGITDGGGNTYFTTRAAAGLAPCSSLANCPLPAPS